VQLDGIEPRVLNEERPPAEIVPHLSDHPPIQVEARIVWADGSEEWVRGHTTRWVRPVAMLTLADGRRRFVWLPVSDVRRLSGQGSEIQRTSDG
jgi:hypothetical protein